MKLLGSLLLGLSTTATSGADILGFDFGLHFHFGGDSKSHDAPAGGQAKPLPPLTKASTTTSARTEAPFREPTTTLSTETPAAVTYAVPSPSVLSPTPQDLR